MKCPKCRKPLREGAKFCPACGAKVNQRKGRRGVAIFLIIVLLLGVIAGGLAIGIAAAKHFGSSKSIPKINSAEEAITHAKKFGEELGYENAMSEMTEKVTAEIDGDCYYRLQQNYKGIPVYGRTVVYTADKEKNVISIAGNLLDIEEKINLIPSITKKQVLNSIKAYLTDTLGFLDFMEPKVESLSKDSINIYVHDGDCFLVYCICANGYEFLVNAHTAEICYVNCLIRFSDVTGNLQGQVRTYQNINYTETNSVFSLEDSLRGISAYTAKKQFQFWKFWNPQWVEVGKDLVTWGHGELANSASVDAFANTKIAYDYFDSKFSNKSFDGKGEIPIKVITETLDLQDNAAFSSDEDAIYIGTAYQYSYTKAAYIDWVAHEYMHGVENKHSEMCYLGESGAIMEGLSDIFGELVEGWSKEENPNWIFTETNRNMISPENTGYPAFYRDVNWVNTVDTNNDWGGVHTNCTVISHAAYLMWNGIDNTASKKLDADTLAKLWYRAMLMMPSDCNFAECRTLVELAASTMNLKDPQIQCVSEAFDAVGIPRASENPNDRLVHYVSTEKTSVKGTIYEVKMVDGIEKVVPVTHATVTVYSSKSKKAYKEIGMTDKEGFFETELPADTYSIVVSAEGYIGNTITFELADKETRYLQIALEPADATKYVEGTEAYQTYLSAAQKTTESGSWSENLSMTANMSITDSRGKTKTKLTMTSKADVSDYSANDLSQVRISGNAEMTAMGRTYAWKMRYENGMAHYDYTQPNQTSASMAIDPSFFNFGTMTSDMMTMAQLSGNQITFTVSGDKISEVGIAAVSQMSGVDDLDYGDVDVTVTISKDGTIDSIAMKFHASLSYQGYDADVDYDLVYQFTPHEGDTAEATTPPYDINNLVSDAYYDYVANTLYNAEGFYHIPKVNADLPRIDETNAKIYDDYYSYMQTHVYGPTNDGTKTGVEKISYIWGVKDSYLSILMSVVWGAEPMCEVYTVSLETGALIDNNDVLSAYDITLEGFNELAEQASRRLGDNIRWPVPYINPGNADLCAMGSSEEWGWSVLVNLTGTSEPVRPWDTKDVRPQVSEHTFVPDEELLTIQPGYYVEEGNANNTLTVHTVSDHSLTFSTFWYRVGDISKATATGIGEVVTFDHSGQNMRASGSIRFEEESAVLTLTDCNNPYISKGDYHFKLIGRVLTDKQLAEISAALGVPENLNVEITQGTPAYWEGGGFYRTNVEILHNGELIAGASVDSITGSLAGNIYTYSG